MVSRSAVRVLVFERIVYSVSADSETCPVRLCFLWMIRYYDLLIGDIISSVSRNFRLSNEEESIRAFDITDSLR